MQIVPISKLTEYKDQILKKHSYEVLTISLKTYKNWMSNEKAKIKLSNIVSYLENRSDEIHDEKKVLTKLNKLVKDEKFWMNQSKGLVYLKSDDLELLIKVPVNVKTEVTLSNYFNIRDLANFMNDRDTWYVLSLSYNSNKLYKYHRGLPFETLKLKNDFPKNLEEVIVDGNTNVSVQYHTPVASSKAGGNRANFHGHGGNKDGVEDYKFKYIRYVTDNLIDTLDSNNYKLCLISTDDVNNKFSEYFEKSYLHVSGNPDDQKSKRNLLKVVKEKIKKYTNDRLIANMKNVKNNIELHEDDIKDIVRLAHYGAVEKLFLKNDKRIWGKFDINKGRVNLHNKKNSDSNDLLNVSAVHTLKNSGEAWFLNEDEIIKNKDHFALLRY